MIYLDALKARVDDLKKLTIAKDRDFAVAINYFFDLVGIGLFAKHETALQKEKEEFYKILLASVMERSQRKIQIQALILREVVAVNLVHGAVIFTNNISGMFYFFNDINMGMMIIPSITGAADYFRLPTFPMEEPGNLTPIVAPFIMAGQVH